MEEKRYFIITYGCQMNVSDSELISGIFESMGYVRAEDEWNADIVLFNTCMVREKPVQKLFGRLQELSLSSKRMVKNPILIVAGCVSQKMREEIFDRESAVNIVMGPRSIMELPQLVERALRGERRVTGNFEEEGDSLKELIPKRNNKFSAFVTIMMGCNNFCSYCIVPYTRGREKCFKHEDIINQVKMLVDDGVKEITLLGQNVNSYIDGEVDFPRLLSMIDEIPGEYILRFMTSHPKDMSDSLIEKFGELKHLSDHLHLPIQSGSNAILKLMNRRYTREHYLGLIKKLREVNSELAITTDLIVGFPGESKKDFELTKSLVEEVRYAAAFTFYYSERSGTKACELEGSVPMVERKRRLAELIQIQNRITTELNNGEIGKDYIVLIESVSKKSVDEYQGRALNNRVVNFPISTTRKKIGEITRVRITGSTKFALRGVGELEVGEI